MAKMSITFNGFVDLAADIDRAGGDLHKAVDNALEETQEVVKSNLLPAAAIYDRKGRKGYATGKMYRSIIKDTKIDWIGNVAEVTVGFSTNDGSTIAGFMHSIFVMYGTPRMAKDPNIYNAIKGSRTKKDIEKVQQEVMTKYLHLGGE